MEENFSIKKIWEYIPWSELRFLLYFLIPAYLMLIAFRINGVFKKNECPRCGRELIRISKTWNVWLYNILGLGILPLRKYKCNICHWKGIRWSSKKAVYVKRKKRRSSKIKFDNSDSNLPDK